jgi:hypothetical protein
MHILRLVAFAVVLSTMPGFALARQSGASQSVVIPACKRTPSCAYLCGKGTCYGCSEFACFSCTHGWCTPARSRGGKPIRGGNLNGILKNAPPGAASSNAGNKPVNETPTRNTAPITGRAGGKH